MAAEVLNIVQCRSASPARRVLNAYPTKRVVGSHPLFFLGISHFSSRGKIGQSSYSDQFHLYYSLSIVHHRQLSFGYVERLLEHRGTMIGTVSSVDRLLGLLSHTMGNLDQATGYFEEALAFYRKAGYRPELAWICCDYADLQRERDSESYRAKVMSLLDEGLAITSTLGMRPLMERVLSRREVLGA